MCRTTRLWRFVFLFPAILFCGCAEDKNIATVTGIVKVNGELAKMGGITYIPVDGQSGTAGAVITGGKYMASDVPIGTHKVQIRVSKVVGHKKLYNTPDSPLQPVLEEVLPAKFNSKTELRLDVVAGKNEKDYDLPSK